LPTFLSASIRIYLRLIVISMELFYTDPQNINSTTAEFDRFETQHILKTLRKKKGDSINFTDGQGKLYSGIIESLRPMVKVNYSLVQELSPPSVSISLAVSFIRPTRMDFIIEKGTELGVQKFYLLTTHYSNYFTPNTLHWHKIARQAIKQSLRFFMPEIVVANSLHNFMALLPPAAVKIVFDQNAVMPLAEILYRPDSLASTKIIFLIGPEGGLTKEELDIVRDHDFQLVSLGKFRLRSETAALMAAAAGLFIK